MIFTFNAGGIKTIPWYIAGKNKKRNNRTDGLHGTHNKQINLVMTKNSILGGEGKFQFYFPA